jgi:hypothetical protein
MHLLQVGYDVAVQDVRQVSAAVAAAGNNGSISSMFYAEVRTPGRAASWLTRQLVSQSFSFNTIVAGTALLTATCALQSTCMLMLRSS